MEPIVILGTGLAGATTALELRSQGFPGDIVMVGAETLPPYHRPPLSKGYLRAEEALPEILVQPSEAYAEQRIRLRLETRAARLHPGRSEVELESGERLRYSKLLIATGSRNRALPIQRAELEGVHSLRTVADADRLRSQAGPGKRAVAIGLGFIGSEVTASLRQMGVEVVAIEPARTPLNRVLGDELGGVLADIHREHGVELILQDVPTAFEGAGSLRGVRTAEHGLIECDFAVVGVGSQPNFEFLDGSGIQAENGVLVDQYLETNVPGVFAAGDVANHFNPLMGQRMRVEHYNNAEWQGRAAARNMLGAREPHAAVPSFWSDQYEHTFEYRGHHTDWDEIAIRGDAAARSFVAFFLKGSRVTAALALNRGDEVEAAVPLIEKHTVVDAASLRDESIDLAELGQGAPAAR